MSDHKERAREEWARQRRTRTLRESTDWALLSLSQILYGAYFGITWAIGVFSIVLLVCLYYAGQYRYSQTRNTVVERSNN